MNSDTFNDALKSSFAPKAPIPQLAQIGTGGPSGLTSKFNAPKPPQIQDTRRMGGLHGLRSPKAKKPAFGPQPGQEFGTLAGSMMPKAKTSF